MALETRAVEKSSVSKNQKSVVRVNNMKGIGMYNQLLHYIYEDRSILSEPDMFLLVESLSVLIYGERKIFCEKSIFAV